MKSAAKNSFLLKPLVRALMTVRARQSGLGLLASLPALALAQQLPTGGQVVAGSATISQADAAGMVINQASNKAIINWQGFSIGNGGYVQFVQPGSSSIALNRVVGQDPSSILGRLSSNGQVFLVNPNGVYFGANATVDVAGIVASTMNISNDDFMRGDFRFKRDPNAPANATVVNAGTINANGGYVVLAGDYVSNTGLIQAQLGTAMLASGSALTLQLAGSSLVNYAIDEATLAHLAGVSNAGQILAAGGKVIMTAEVANQLAGTVVNNSGLVQAQGTVEKDGAIYLTGKGGDVVNSGTLDASGGQDGRAGSVHLRASGDLVHEAGSLINVNAGSLGDGGKVDTWADGKNRFKQGATITARGGEEGGDGGFVELSGNSVAYRGNVDLLASKGQGGTLLIDPANITIKNGSGDDDAATFYETNLESALAGSGQVVLQAQNSGQDNTASIVVEDLADNLLSGTGSAGLTLKVSATNGATGSIQFQDVNDRIAVGGQLNLSVDDGEGTGLGSIAAGHLQSNTGINLKAGTISASSLSVLPETSTTTDASYAIRARASTGELKVTGDVRLEVSNDQAAAVDATVDLKADNGAINIGGKVTSNATGLGYYHYNWVTGGNAATSYYGQQPWSIANQGDHAISTKLSIVSGNASDIVIGGDVQALATDTNSVFTTKGVGGYWQTATATTHNFWRPTAASAEATITAGGKVDIGGMTAVKADGYATSVYSEQESWRQMVNNYNFTSGTQTVYTDYGCLSNNSPCTGGYGYRSSYVYTDTRLKGSATGNYIWQFGSYTSSLPGTSYNSPTVYSNTDSLGDSAAGPMGYTGARGLTAKLNVTAGQSVTMGGMDVRATNRAGTGGAIYTDVNWAHQDTAANLNNTANSFVSNNRETDWSDTFSTRYSAASTDAQASVVAGAGSAITVNGTGATVVASNTVNSSDSSTLEFAKLSLLAGSGEGAQTGAIQLNSPVLVEGASDRSINLSVQNRDGDIQQGATANISVINHYYGGDASASLNADRGNASLGAISVSAGAAASLNARAKENLGTGVLSATGSTTATVDLEGTQGELNANGGISASAASASIALKSGTKTVVDGDVTATASSATGSATIGMTAGGALTTNGAVHANALQSQINGIYPNYSVAGGAASVSLSSEDDLSVNGNVSSNAFRNAALSLNSQQGALSLAAGKTAKAQATGVGYNTQNYAYSYASTVDVSANSGMTLNGDLSSTALAGSASMNVKTLGGAQAKISQDAASTVSVNGRVATLKVMAGSDQAVVDNMAAADMKGALNVSANQTDAALQVQAASGTVNNFSVSATAGKAQADLSALKGNLDLTGTGSVTGNANTSDAARLTVSSSGVLHAAGSTLSVSNANSGAAGGASASFSAGNVAEDSNSLGGVNVSASNSATVSTEISGPLQVSGAIAALASGINGQAQASISSGLADLTIAANGSVSSKALATGGTASTTLSGVTGVTVNGNLLAQAGNAATVNVSSTGGDQGAIKQGANSEIKAAGTTATLNVKAGNAAPTAETAATFALEGALKAEAGSGASSIAVKGKSGSVHNINATSVSNTVTVAVDALSGDLAMNGAVNLNGNLDSASAVSLGLTASGALDASTADMVVNNASNGSLAAANATLNAAQALKLGGLDLSANNAASVSATTGSDLTVGGAVVSTARAGSGTAQASLSASQGSLAVAQGASVRASSAGSATTTLQAKNGMQIDGSVSSNATSGTASTTLTTTNGNTAAINQGSAGVIAASGAIASVSLLAGNAQPTAENAAALNLDGTVKAEATSGASTLSAKGKSVRLQDLSVSSQNNSATVQINAVDGDLNLNGTATLSANLNTGTAATLGLNASGAIDSAAGTISVKNLNGGSLAGAVSNLTALGSLTLGEASVEAGRAATLNVSSQGALGVAGNITVNASGLDSNAALNLSANQGVLTVNAGKTVKSIGLYGANATLSADNGMQINGDVASSASAGTASTSLSTTLAQAAIVQGSQSTVSADGKLASASVRAGVAQVNNVDTFNATIDLGGMVKSHAGNGTASTTIGAASGSVNQLQALSDNGTATLDVATSDSNASLNVKGALKAQGNANQEEGALLKLQSAGALDSGLGSVEASNLSQDSDAQAKASIAANGGELALGQVSASASQAVISTSSQGQTRVLAALTSTGVNNASISLQSGGKLKLQSDLEANASAGEATLKLGIAEGYTADVVQDAGRSITVKGRSASLNASIGGGQLALGGSAVINGQESAAMTLGARQVEVKDFTLKSVYGTAQATITGQDGGVQLKGAGSVTGVGSQDDGAALRVSSTGALDTRGATLSVNNSTGLSQPNSNGGDLNANSLGAAPTGGGALLQMAASGLMQTGVLNASTDGAGTAAIKLAAGGALSLNGNVAALATGNGNATVKLGSGVSTQDLMGPSNVNVVAQQVFQPELTGNISQSAGTLIKANAQSGNALVDLQAGNCCKGTITLAGTVESTVDAGAGNARIAMRGTQITASQLRANGGVNNSGAAGISLLASDSIAINGLLDLQAKNPAAHADLQLVSDTLNWSGASLVSNNNVKVQLAPFSPGRLIGVESDQDFDAQPQTNYSQNMLRNFTGHGATIVFGGEVDRSAFNQSALQSLIQQTADIHVAGNGHLDLGDVKMVFDTTGTTYYHDPRMSPWSVPTGRMAVYVARPNVDRYLDRTENTLQNMTRVLENSNPGSGSTPQVNAGVNGPVAGTTHISGNLFMAGDGVNTGNSVEGGKGEAGKGGPGNAASGDKLDKDAERKRDGNEDQPG